MHQIIPALPYKFIIPYKTSRQVHQHSEASDFSMVIRMLTGKIRRTRQQSGDGKYLLSASAVSNDDNLLREFFFRLPVYNLRNSPPISGVFLHRTSILGNPEFEFISLDSTTKSAPFKSLTFVNDPVGIKILQSCNGLLCCSSFRTNSKTYYIYNPTTKQYTILPKACSVPGSNRGFICSVSLAFNPLKSPDYKVVCMHNIGSDDEYQISIYSSNTSSWRFVGGTFTASGLVYLSGIYWNGALHFRTSEDCCLCLCFDVEKELFRTMPLPPIPVGREERRVDYLGASRDHLYLIQRFDYGNKLYILDMERDYSCWKVRYEMNLTTITTAYPEMIRHYLGTLDWNYYAFSVLLVQGETETPCVLLHVPGKIILYNHKDETFETLREFSTGVHETGPFLQYAWFDSYPYIETLSYA